jgi:hypothetical protein
MTTVYSGVRTEGPHLLLLTAPAATGVGRWAQLSVSHSQLFQSTIL